MISLGEILDMLAEREDIDHIVVEYWRRALPPRRGKMFDNSGTVRLYVEKSDGDSVKYQSFQLTDEFRATVVPEVGRGFLRRQIARLLKDDDGAAS